MQKKGLTENKVEGKEERIELDALRKHTLVRKECGFQTAAGVWLVYGSVLHTGVEISLLSRNSAFPGKC